jgi:type I restriction enzyme S subunit
LLENDIVFSRVGRVGSCFLTTKREVGWIISGQLLRIRLQNSGVNYQFLYYALKSEKVQSYLKGSSVGSTRESINTTILENLQLAIPAPPEQEKIGKILSAMDEKLNVLQEKKEGYQELKKGLMQQLLTGKIRVNHLIETDVFA